MNISSLWDGNRILLPEAIKAAYSSVLSASGLLDVALAPRPDPPPIGGLSQGQTDEHFCHAFDGSLARVQLALLDPHGTAPVTSATLRAFLAGGDVCLVDVPCGAGAGALALLGAVAHFRNLSILPRHPLNVRLLWGEISQPAIGYAITLLSMLKDEFESQGIFVTVESFNWDVLDQLSNMELVERIVLAKTSTPQILLVVCNFSGFLERSKKWNQALPGLDMLFKFCSGDLNAAIWLEPDQRSVELGLFERIRRFIGERLQFTGFKIPGGASESCNARFASPLKEDSSPRVNLRVLPLDLNLTKRAVK